MNADKKMPTQPVQDDLKMDDVLRRMLSTPPPKPEKPKQQKKKTGQ